MYLCKIDCNHPCSPWEILGQGTLSHTHCCEVTNWGIESHQHLACHLNTASKFASNLTRVWPPTESPHWLHHSLRVPLGVYSLNYGLQVHTFMDSKCTSKLAWSQPHSASQRRLTQLCPPCLHDDGLKGHLQTRSITTSECISKFSCSVLSMGAGILPAVWVRTTTTDPFGPRPIQYADLHHLCRPNIVLYPSTTRLCWVWPDPFVHIPSSGFQVFQFMVAFWYPTANHKYWLW